MTKVRRPDDPFRVDIQQVHTDERDGVEMLIDLRGILAEVEVEKPSNFKKRLIVITVGQWEQYRPFGGSTEIVLRGVADSVDVGGREKDCVRVAESGVRDNFCWRLTAEQLAALERAIEAETDNKKLAGKYAAFLEPHFGRDEAQRMAREAYPH